MSSDQPTSKLLLYNRLRPPSHVDREDEEEEEDDEGIQKVALKSLKIAYVVV